MNVEQAHEYSSQHRELILKPKRVGCFYCLRTYRPSKIKEWVDGGETALCPYCGIDSVLPEFQGLIEPAFLQAMYDRWFKYDPNNHTYYKMDQGHIAKIVEVKDGKETTKWEWTEED